MDLTMNEPELPTSEEFNRLLYQMYEYGARPEWIMDKDGNMVDFNGLNRSAKDVLGFEP